MFGKLADAGQTWKIYGYSGEPLTAHDFPDTVAARPEREVVSGFARFQSDAANGTLAALSYIEPEWATHPRSPHQPDDGHILHLENDQHPISRAIGEKLLYDVYQALRSGPAWGDRPCSSSPTTSTAAITTTCPRRRGRSHRTT